MFELLNETLFEKHMAEYLAGSKMYNQRTPKDFNMGYHQHLLQMLL